MAGSLVRFGVIGAGAFAARRHIPDIIHHPDAELAAICRRDDGALARLAAHFEASATFTDWRRMLEECALDAVVIASSNEVHYEQALAALERGLHVVLEKPMTLHADEARRLVDAANERGLKLAVALNPPYWAHCHAIRRAITHGHIGDVEAISFYWTGNSGVVFGDVEMPDDMPGPVKPSLFRADPKRCGGGHFMDGGAHLVSEIVWTTGLRASSVTCQMDRTPSDRRAALSLVLENGAIASITSLGNSRNTARRVRNIIGGSSGTITIDGFEFTTSIHGHGIEEATFAEADLPPVQGPVANLVDAVLHGAEVSSPAEHGLHVQEVLDGAYRSAAEGTRITI